MDIKKDNWTLGLGGALVVLLIAYVSIVLWVYLVKPYFPFVEKFLVVPTEVNLQNAKMAGTLSKLVASGTVIPIGEFYGHIISYYNTLITLMMALLGIVSLVAYMYIRSVSTEEAEKKALEHTKDCFKSQVPGMLAANTAEWSSDFQEEMDGLKAKVEALENEIERLKTEGGTSSTDTVDLNGNNQEQTTV